MSASKEALDRGPISRRRLKQGSIGCLFIPGRIPGVCVDHSLDFAVDQFGDDGRVKGVEFPALSAKFLGVGRISGVALLRKIGRRPVSVDLVHVQCKPSNFDASARKHGKSIAIVASHVEPVRIMVAEVQVDWRQAALLLLLESLPGLVLFAFRIVAPTSEIGHAIFVADSLDHAEQRVLFDPNFGAEILAAPQVFAVLPCGAPPRCPPGYPMKGGGAYCACGPLSRPNRLVRTAARF